ncbi:MAG: 1-acyl-sn-glycerol-3-phosphate acyltransferase [Candidatus Aminicenantes bacterium]|nr:MAG: 1-acyl-sn-glycerol-3-phosphate acyltransferase [Candidatus Aminicenantes bacterium]
MRHLISAYAWLVGGLYFILLLFLCIILSFFIRQKTLDPFIKKSLRLLFKILFIKVHAKGTENVEPNKTYLFMSNHESLFDIPLLEAYVPTFVRGVEAMRQFKWPVYGWAIRQVGNIPIDRKNIHASIKSMKITEKTLKKGKSIIILPEGHRTLDGNLGSFKKLPFHLAKQAGVPVIPIGLSGLFELKHKGSWLIRPRPIKIKFGQPISPDKIRSLSTEELRDYIREKIQNLIE